MPTSKRIRLLLAYDGSDLALDAVRYIAGTFSRHRSYIVIFYVETKIPKAFWHMEQGLDFRFRAPEIRASMAQHQKTVTVRMEAAKEILLTAGFPSKRIFTKVHIKNIGVAADIVEEARQGYDALVMGRKGQNRIKDLLSAPLPVKLVGKITSIPLIVVGKTRAPQNVLIAFDGTREISRAVESMAQLMDAQGKQLLLCHCSNELQETDIKVSPRLFDHPRAFFLDAGFTRDQIRCEIMLQAPPLFSEHP